jgi:peroxiredoxin
LSVAPIVDALAPGFTLPTLDGETVELDGLRGQPVLVSFWATQCWACRQQMPYLQAAFEEKGQEVKFIAVNIGESSDTVRQFVEYEGLGFTVALDRNGAAATAYNIRFIPTTFLIDEQGVIKQLRLGAFMSKSELLVMLEGL